MNCNKLTNYIAVSDFKRTCDRIRSSAQHLRISAYDTIGIKNVFLSDLYIFTDNNIGVKNTSIADPGSGIDITIGADYNIVSNLSTWFNYCCRMNFSHFNLFLKKSDTDLHGLFRHGFTLINTV
ncbi:MAG: hypothetical protein BWY69_01135 [Planctomycetes bacterium ADurb.Bin401]|nr:MAG: hypothetical protein BWY69_01135 [Planctomycetes bacterium ADurb.Bin401]